MPSLSPPPDTDPPPAAPNPPRSIPPALAAAARPRPRRDLSPSSTSSASSIEVGHATTLPRISRVRSPRHAVLTASLAHQQSHPSRTASASPSSIDGDDIEMDHLRGGSGGNTRAASSHRRRRSSLMNDIVTSPSSSSAGTTAASASAPGSSNGRPHQHSAVSPPGKISEEGFDADAAEVADETSDASSLSGSNLQDDEEMGLTKQERNRRKGKRRRNAQLDQRIVRERISPDEKKEADQNVARRLAVNGGLIGLWYLFSLSISLYNKWMFDDGKLNFPFPLFTTALHMLVQFTLSSLILYIFPHFRPQHAGAHGHGHASDRGRSRHAAEPTDKSPMTRWFYWTRIGPCGAATGLDIGLGNTSLKFITLTFYTMCKSSALAFVLLFAFLFRLETPTWRLVAIIATMTVGVIMMVAGEVEFSLPGFLLVISAAFFSGFRWGLTQILLLRHPATSNPFSSIFYLAPMMFLTLALIAIPSEGLLDIFRGVGELAATHGYFVTPLLLIFPGTIAFAMTASEFALLQRTSVVTLSIAGIFKEVVTIGAAALVYDDSLTPINFSGLVVTIGAIVAYNWIKIRRMREDAQKEVHRTHLIYDATAAAEEGSAFVVPGNVAGVGSDSDADDDLDDDMDGLETRGLMKHHRQEEGLMTRAGGGDGGNEAIVLATNPGESHLQQTLS